MESLENVCTNAREYKAIAGPDFPYLKGGKYFFMKCEINETCRGGGVVLQSNCACYFVIKQC